MSEQPADNDAPTEVLADLIDRWWENDEHRTLYHDGIEHIASMTLADFLIENDVIPPASTGSAS